MDINQFYCPQKTIEKIISKHGVELYEVEEVFQSDVKTRAVKGVHIALGRSQAGRYLVVVFKKKAKDSIRIITARDMNDAEKKLYRR